MNRKKKVKETLKAQIKRKNAKMNNSKKPKYISKAERAKIAEQSEVDSQVTVTESNNTDNQSVDN